MGNPTRYQIVYCGEVDPGWHPERVRAGVAAHFQLDKNVVDQMFSGQRIVLKKDVDHVTATSYLDALRRLGAVATMQPLHHDAGEVALQREEPEDDERVYCPSCDAAQQPSPRCPYCGFVFEPERKREPLPTREQIEARIKHKGPDTRAFSEHLPAVFAYPLQGTGGYILIGGSLFFFVLGIGAQFPILGILFSLFAGGYLASYLLRVAESSADGKDSPPDWPGFSSWGQVFAPLAQFAGSAFLAFGPAFVYYHFALGPDPASSPVLWLLVSFGVLYFPMALLAVAMTGNVIAASPHFVIVSIYRVWKDHFIASVLMLVTFFAGWFAVAVTTSGNSLLGALVAYPLSLYMLIVEMRIIGVLYRSNAGKLDWF